MFIDKSATFRWSTAPYNKNTHPRTRTIPVTYIYIRPVTFRYRIVTKNAKNDECNS